MSEAYDRLKYKRPEEYGFRICPVCKTKFRMRGTVEEWGPVVENTPCCSIPCMRALEEIRFRRNVKRLLDSGAYRMYVEAQKEGNYRVAHRYGISENAVYWNRERMLDVWWRECEWLDAHGGELHDDDLRHYSGGLGVGELPEGGQGESGDGDPAAGRGPVPVCQRKAGGTNRRGAGRPKKDWEARPRPGPDGELRPARGHIPDRVKEKLEILDRIEARLEELDWTMAETAERAGLSIGTVYNWWKTGSGFREPQWDKLILMMRAVGLEEKQ